MSETAAVPVLNRRGAVVIDSRDLARRMGRDQGAVIARIEEMLRIEPALDRNFRIERRQERDGGIGEIDHVDIDETGFCVLAMRPDGGIDDEVRREVLAAFADSAAALRHLGSNALVVDADLPASVKLPTAAGRLGLETSRLLQVLGMLGWLGAEDEDMPTPAPAACAAGLAGLRRVTVEEIDGSVSVEKSMALSPRAVALLQAVMPGAPKVPGRRIDPVEEAVDATIASPAGRETAAIPFVRPAAEPPTEPPASRDWTNVFAATSG